MRLEPLGECILVEIVGELQFVEMPDKQYATNTSGIVKKVSFLLSEEYDYLVGKTVFFEGFKDVEVMVDDKKYAFIKFKDVRGYDKAI